jgi:hypothetical protein
MENNQPSTYESIALSVDGEPLIQRYERRGNVNAFQAEQILTLSGEPANVSADAVFDEGYLEGADRYVPASPLPWWQRLVSFNDGGTPPVYWYLIHDGRIPGRAYGIGFHSKAKTVVGYFARKGFLQSPPPRDEWFHVDSQLMGQTTAPNTMSEPQFNMAEPVFLLADGKLWKIDVARRRLRALADCPAAYTLSTTWQIPPKSETTDKSAATADESDDQPKLPENTDRIAVRQPEELIVFDKRTNKELRFRLPNKVRDMAFSAWALADGTLVLLTPADEEKKILPELWWVDSAGKVLKQQTVRLAEAEPYRLPIPEVWRENIRAPVPLNKALLFALMTHVEAQRATPPSYAVGFGKVFKRAWLAALVLFAACAIPAYAAYRRQKRFGLPYAGVWAAFTYLLGIPGWIAYRFHRRWPVMEECPNCRQVSPRDRETCLDCGAVFPPPPLKGIEVFA